MAHTVRLHRLTTLRIGGAPLLYYRPADEAELRRAIDQCRRSGLPWRVLGGGSNLLVEDGELSFAVIHVRAPGLARIERTGPASLRVGAGVLTRTLLAYCRRHGPPAQPHSSSKPRCGTMEIRPRKKLREFAHSETP